MDSTIKIRFTSGEPDLGEGKMQPKRHVMEGIDIADLDAFIAVARARSFRGAASLKNVTPSTYSRAIRRLEGYLNVELFFRTTKRVEITVEGQELLDRVTPAIEQIASIVKDLRVECADGRTMNFGDMDKRRAAAASAAPGETKLATAALRTDEANSRSEPGVDVDPSARRSQVDPAG